MMKLSKQFYIDMIDRLLDEGTITDVASGYGEPGYSFKESISIEGVLEGTQIDSIVFANYNEAWWKKHSRIQAQLEAQGVEFEWLDEWTVIDDKAYRTQPDSYMWQPSWVLVDDEYRATNDPDDPYWLQDLIDNIVNDPKKAINVHQDISGALTMGGWVKVDEYQTGWHQGMDADPGAVYDWIIAGSEHRDVIMVITEQSQFYISWTPWYKWHEDVYSTPWGIVGVGTMESCMYCGQDIQYFGPKPPADEWFKSWGWVDRGSGNTCLPTSRFSEPQHHEPYRGL